MGGQGTASVQPGDRMPFWYGLREDGRFYSFEAQLGRPAVMLAVANSAGVDLSPILSAFMDKAEAFARHQADVLVLAEEDVVRALRLALPAPGPIRTLDCNPAFLSWGECDGDGVVTLVVDRNQRLVHRSAAGEDHVARCLEALDRLPREVPHEVVLPAPVLLLPNLLPRALCAGLIERFETAPSFEGGVASIDADGAPVSRVDQAKKHRRDHLIAPEETLHAQLCDLLLRRCAPEINRAFQARVAHLDRILIARYDEGRGLFRRHRDNTADNVAFREFAISVNLNTEDYEGGHLFFPEYNDHGYRPPTGGGLIFSASILHEATRVTRGCRYVLLTFFHGDAAEAQRRAYHANTAPSAA